MSAEVQAPTTPTTSRTASPARQVASLVRRNLIHIRRMPELLSDVTVQPVMFVLLFAFVFGGAIDVDGASYREWLMPGIMVQTMAFSAFVVALGLNNDMTKGIIDRFRSLPLQSWSVLVARSISSILHSSIGVLVMAITGLIIGWRLRGSLIESVTGFAILVLFGFAMIWVGILFGSLVKTAEAVNTLMFTSIFPLTFLSNAFAPAERMPTFLRWVAEWNPVSAQVQALRNLWGNGVPAPADAAYPLQHPEIAAVLWSVAIIVFFAPGAIKVFTVRTTN